MLLLELETAPGQTFPIEKIEKVCPEKR